MSGLAAALVALLLLAAAGALFGHAPREIFTVLLRGAFGSRFALEGSILKTVPLLLTGLSVAVAFRAGVWNIGAEGQFIAGALAAFIAAPFGAVAALGAAILAGAAWASLATLLRLWRGAPEVLTTILLNFTALHLLGWCVNGPLHERAAQYPQTDRVAASLAGYGSLHAGVLLALLAAVALWFYVERTAGGLKLRATGLSPSAAEWAGINVRATIARSMALSGSLAGLAGGIELLGVTGRLFERFAVGYGYSGIAVALLAQLNPLGTILSALFFGTLAGGAGELQRSMNVSAAVAMLAQAAAVLVLLLFAAFERRRRWSN